MPAKLLVVDDEESPRRVLKIELINVGHEVQEASDGDEAIAMIDRERFDLLILDVKMPRVNGFEVLKYSKEKHPDTKVIMMTSFLDLKAAVEARKLGADDLLEKPYDSSAMLAAVERALHLPQKGTAGPGPTGT